MTRAMAKTASRGFTLIELMVVIVILGALVALVGPNVWNMLAGGTKSSVEFQIRNFQRSVDSYYLDKRTLPNSLQDLTAQNPSTGEPWLTEVPPDPWGENYEYRVVNATKREYAISSSGPDKQHGSEDDIEWTSATGFKK